MRRTEYKEEENKIIAEERQKKLAAKEQQPKQPDKPSESQQQLPNYKRQKLEAKEITEEQRDYVDFFGRTLKRTTPEVKREKKLEETIGGEIWFKFKEGYSNAVRRTVRVQQFL